MENLIITRVYTVNDTVYFAEGEEEDVFINGLTIHHCKFTKTEFGSVIIERERHDKKIIELYPSSISHLVHRKA